jgi:hypothetical protein
MTVALWMVVPPRQRRAIRISDRKGPTPIILGIILLILGFVFGIPILWTDRHHPDRCRRGAHHSGRHRPRRRRPENLVLNPVSH